MQSHASLKKVIKGLQNDLQELRKAYSASAALAVDNQAQFNEAAENFRREKAIVNHLIEY